MPARFWMKTRLTNPHLFYRRCWKCIEWIRSFYNSDIWRNLGWTCRRIVLFVVTGGRNECLYIKQVLVGDCKHFLFFYWWSIADLGWIWNQILLDRHPFLVIYPLYIKGPWPGLTNATFIKKDRRSFMAVLYGCPLRLSFIYKKDRRSWKPNSQVLKDGTSFIRTAGPGSRIARF